MSYISKFLLFTGVICGLFIGIVAFNTHSAAAFNDASLRGMVVDENGDAISNASGTMKKIKFRESKEVEIPFSTDRNGVFTLSGSVRGSWELEFNTLGYETLSKTVKIGFNEEVEETFTLDFAEYVKTNDTASIDAAVDAFNTIGTLRREDPIDTDAITAEYAGDLQDLTQQIDSDFGLTLDSDILGAIDDIVNDNEPKLAAQVIDKTIQRVFFITTLDRTREAKDDFDESNTDALSLLWDESFAAYQAIVGTADRDNKVLTEDRLAIETGSNPNLEDQITVAFIRGRDALDKDNGDEDEISINIQRQVIRLSLVRAYYIGVLREVEGIISNRDSDEEAAKEKQKEGEVFYSIIEEWISRDNSIGNDIVKAQLTGDVADVVADEIVSEMSKGFIVRARGEVDGNEEEFTDRKEAMILAEEALLYSNVFLEDLGLRLGSDKQDEIDAALKVLKDASDNGDADTASDARDTIETILDNYEGELNLFEFVKTSDTSAIDAAVDAFGAIGTLRREDPIDADAITAEYEGELQDLTQEMDTEFGLTLDSDILGAIDDIRNDNEPKLAAQVIDKTIQRVFFLIIFNGTTGVEDGFDNETAETLSLHWDESYAAFQAIEGTADRENKVLTEDRLSIETGNDPDLDDDITVAFILGQDALEKNDADEDKITIGLQKSVINLSLGRAFYIAVLREVEGIIDNRDSDIEEAREKQKEGEVFYSIIEEFISRENPSGNIIIKTQLTGDVADVVADTIVSELSKGFTGQVTSGLDSIGTDFSSGDRGGAMNTAEEICLFSSAFLEDLELRLGSSQRDDIEDALEDLKDASDESDLPKANGSIQSISTIITNYEGELL